MIDCHICDGTGFIDVTLYLEHDTGQIPCSHCNGTGKVEDKEDTLDTHGSFVRTQI